MGRNTTADKTPLLDDAEQNIGNSAIVQPQAGSAGTVIPQIIKDRIIQLQGGSAAGQTTTVVMTASRIVGADNPSPGFPGPITGVVEFGNGGRSTKVEFDVPVGPFDGSINQASNAVEPQDGAVVVTVPTSVVRAYARYDNLLLAPLLGTDPPISQAQAAGVVPVGPGGPLWCQVIPTPPPTIPLSPQSVLVPPEPVLVKAMAAYFSKAYSKVYKTLNCYLTSETNATPPPPVNPPSAALPPVPIFINGAGAAQIAGYADYSFWVLPTLTKRVKILRFPDTTALDVLLHDGVRPVDYIEITAGTAPTIDIIGNQNIIGITTSTASHGSNKVSMLKLVCEIGI